MIPFKNRFHGHKSLSYVYKNGQAIRSRLITVKYVANSHRKESRFAIVVSKKTLKSAVRRNRIRRRLYEYIRPKIDLLNGVYDVVFIVSSSEMFSIPSQDMVELLDQLVDQMNILKTTKAKQKD